ncbi:MAG: hypothetical protein ACD_49C00083G0001 [uncultured bacterium (gcode 4)]|uniref:Uncharacterized protein n=1 Tax=uncultured bacterium (gcode 4) TaxID=1234023 RepID=K2BUA7_9BACT|nr:MAG: hypothetical protein ACD_49C00083G0001 [uncultured bacterium (gcode 4)]
MNIKKILKLLKDKKKLIYWLKIILPITLLIWILWQIVILSKYNAIALFSWSQIFSDTVILFLPLLSGFAWYFSLKILDMIDWVNNKIKIYSLLFILFIIIIYSFIMGILSYYNYIPFNFYLNSLNILFVSWAIFSFNSTLKIDKDNKTSDKFLFIFPSLILILITLSFTIILWLFGILYSYVYRNIKIEISNKQYEIQYMNDKYIIYWSWKITPNDWKNKFIINNSFK